MRARARLGAAVLSGVFVAGLTLGPNPTAQAQGSQQFSCDALSVDQPGGPDVAEQASRPFASLRIRQAWRLLEARGLNNPGQGSTVAVLGSGVVAGGVAVSSRVSFTGNSAIDDWSGTALAGLVAGHVRPTGKEVGFAPGANIVDVKVYDAPTAGDDASPPNSANLTRGLDWVADNARARGIDIALVGVGVPGSPAMRSAIQRLQRLNVLVVAPTGIRPIDEADPLFGAFGGAPKNGEDAARSVYPGGYPGVLGVNATPDGSDAGVEAVLANSATDIAAPTYNLVSASTAGGTCVVRAVDSAMATAEVAGVAALLRQAFPRESGEQLAARLLQTASGTVGSRSRYRGHGVVQPVEALARDLPAKSNQVLKPVSADNSDETAARAPQAAVDPLAELKRNIVWVGLFGAALLALATLLRTLVRHFQR